MENSNGTGIEEVSGWKSANVGGHGTASTLSDGQVNAHRPKGRPAWEMPLVPAFPEHRRTPIIRPHGVKNVTRLTVKICVLGDSGVGKTSMVRRYAQDRFEDEYLTTCGAKVTMKEIKLDYPERNLHARLTVQIWDVTGERRAGINTAFFRGASGALVVGDAVRLETQLDVWKWIEDFRRVAGNVPVLIAINKKDIMDRQEFDPLLMDDISKEYRCLHTMTSARINDNVDGAFGMLCDLLVRRMLTGELEGAKAC